MTPGRRVVTGDYARSEPRGLHALPHSPARAARWHERSGRLKLFALGALVLVTRLPFLGPGYGRDPDAWRLADSSRRIATSGEYVLSRPPGHPVPEIAGALVWRGGPLALNALSAAACAATTVLLAALLLRTRPRAAFPAALAFAFTPVVYVASCSAMDYLWALAFASGALLAASRARPCACGLLMGLAIGARLPDGVLLLPCALLLSRGRGGARAALVASAVALGTAALCFAPVLSSYELAQLAPVRVPWHPRLRPLLGLISVRSFGPVGAVAVALALVAAAVSRHTGSGRARTLERALLLGLASSLAVFAWMPYHAEYLLPSIALTLMLVVPRLPAPAAWLLAGALALSSFVEPLGSSLAPGPILRDHAARSEEQRQLERILLAARAIEPPPLLVAGPWMPKLSCAVASSGGEELELRFALLPDHAERLRARGRAYFFVDDIAGWHATQYGVSLEELGARPLFGGAGAQ